MAERMGGKLIYGLGVFLTAVLTVISPFAAYWGLVPFLVVRVAEGFTEVFQLLHFTKRILRFTDCSYFTCFAYFTRVGRDISRDAQYAGALGATVGEK